MFGGPGGMARVMGQDNIKPQSVRRTLGRLAGYFKPYWLPLLFVGALVDRFNLGPGPGAGIDRRDC